MKPNRLAAAFSAAALLAVPFSGQVASAAALSQRPHLQMMAAQLSPQREKLLPFAGYAKPGQPVDLLVHLPLRNKAEATALAAQMATPKSPLYHKWLTPAQFAARYGPRQSDLLAAAAAMRAAGFTVTKIDTQNVRVTGSVSTVERTFNTRMGLVHDGPALHLDARAPFSLPSSLVRLNAAVVGLQAVPHYHAEHMVLGRGVQFPKVAPGTKRALAPQAFYGSLGPYFPSELLQTYGEPSYTYANGTGMHIGIVGYSDSADSDNHGLWCYYGLGTSCGFGITLGAYPTVNHYDYTGYIPPNTDDNSLEASLDAQMAGGSAAGAVIDQYAADYSSNIAFLTVYSDIATANVDDIITTSYSECEYDYLSGAVAFIVLIVYDDTFLQGNMQGQTWLFSSGDNGSHGCGYEGDHVDNYTSAFASDPNVTAVGGTTQLMTSFIDNGYGSGYVSESSESNSASDWASGGGFSQLFVTPGFQTAIGLPAGSVNGTYGAPYGTGRQVPDISMHMGGPGYPFTADWVDSTLYGGFIAVTGTSASSPELAGWIADAVTSVNSSLGHSGSGFRLGNINNVFYYEQAIGLGQTIYNQLIPSNNFGYSYNPSFYNRHVGYNPIIGLGTPKFSELMGVLGLGGSYQFAGDSVTASNP